MHAGDLVFETGSTLNHCKPSETKHAFAVIYEVNKGDSQCPYIFGKWLVFEYYDKINEVWEKVRTAIAKNKLGGCQSAKCTTTRYDPRKSGPGPNKYSVISVHTRRGNNMTAIGYRLIHIVKKDIKYKTHEATQNYQFLHAGSENVTCKTYYWNDGKQSFTRNQTLKQSDKPPQKEDKWHVNVVIAPEPLGSIKASGRWVLKVENTELTKLWHCIKNIIECKEENFGITKMVCPRKFEQLSATEKPVFHVYMNSSMTSRSVGRKLIKLVQRDLIFEGFGTPWDSLVWIIIMKILGTYVIEYFEISRV